MPNTAPNEGPQESLNERFPDANRDALRQRDAGAEKVYARMAKKAETDPEMARLLQAESAQDVEDAVKEVVQQDVRTADSVMSATAKRLASIEQAKLTLYPDGRVEVEGPVQRIAELLEEAKRERRV